MKTGCFCAFWALILALVSACGTKTKGSGNLDTIIETRADSIPIHEILQPCFLLERASWNAVGDKAVIMNSGSNDSLVYVYRLPDFEFLYAGIRAGNGPEDLHSWTYSIVPRGYSSLLFWNPSISGTYATLTDTGFILSKQINGDYDWAPGRIPDMDSMQIDYSFGQYDRSSLFLFLYDLNQKHRLDSVRLDHQLFFEKVRQYDVYRNMPHTVANRDRSVYAAVYPFTGRVEFYDVSTGKLVLKKTLPGDGLSAEDLKEKDFSNSPTYVQTASDGNYLYVLESTRKDNKVFDTYILVYDWQGNPVGKYHPDKLIHTILAYQGKIYGYNKDLDFEQVYVFDLGV